jgi:hypothetical protein
VALSVVLGTSETPVRRLAPKGVLLQPCFCLAGTSASLQRSGGSAIFADCCSAQGAEKAFAAYPLPTTITTSV